MEKIYVMDNRGHETEAFKIRYFEYDNASYFIYTLGEIDKDEYVKLYLKMIVNGEEQNITENEWVRIKGIIQKIVKEIKSGNIVSFKDKDMSNLNEIMESDTRIFKLKKSIVEEIIYEEPKVEIKDLEPVEEVIVQDEPVVELPKKNIDNSPDSFIESLEHSIKNTFVEDLSPRNKVKSDFDEPVIKPIIPEKPVDDTKQKYEAALKQLEEYKVISYKLKEENTILRRELIKYREKLEQLKIIVKDI